MKKAYILIGIVLLIVGIVFNIKIKQKDSNDVIEEIEKDEIVNSDYISIDMIMELTKSSPDWSIIDIPKENLEKIKQKYPKGIFDGEEYEEVRLKKDYKALIHDTDMGRDMFTLIAKKGLKEVEYTVWCETGSILEKDSFGIYTIIKKVLYDENGNKVYYPMDEEHWIENLKAICVRDDREVGRTQRFDEEHPNFTGLVNPYNRDEKGIIIKINDNLSSFENKKLHCYITTNYNSYVTEYVILFSVDEKNYLDAVILNIIDQREDDNSLQAILNSKKINLMSSFIFNRLIYKNRNIMNIPISQKLKERLKKDGSLVSNYANLTHYDSYYIEKQYKNNKILCKLYFDDDSYAYYGFEYIIDNNQIEDIKVTKLQFDSTAEQAINELYNMF